MSKMTRLEIQRFRLFQNQTFFLGRMLTVISGQNGTGKSNLLGLIGNCIEFKKSRQRGSSTFSPRVFRTDFSELFIASQDHDLTGSELMTFYFDDDDSRKARITWQKYKEAKRFRIIPYQDKEGKRTSAKKQMASIYLGLSRLFPYGESQKCTKHSLQRSSSEAIKWIKDNACEILSMTESIEDIEEVNVSETLRKRGIGFKTKDYDVLANSAGQDNIGQMLSAIWNIKTLKTELGDSFPGAILLIDEIDATLHPASQLKLLKLLTKEARDSAFQVVCTTHSLCLLENITSKTLHNSPDENNIELIYLTKASGSLKIFRNPQYELILNDLRESTINHQTPVKVYAEDDESRWLLRKLLERTPQNNIMGRVNIVDGITLGCMEAKKLFEKDPTTFGNILFVCDGDVSCTEPHQNFVRLPGNTRPESLIIDFLCNQTDSADFFDQDSSGLMNMGFSWRNFCMERERLKETAVLRQKEREVYKNWFQEKLPYFEQFRLFDYWYDKHQDEAKTFQNSFVEGFNRIAKRLCVPAISPMANGK